MKSEFFSIQDEKNVSYPEADIYLYLGWINSKNILGLAISSSPFSLPHVIKSNLFNLLDFFASHFFVFSSESIFQELQTSIKKSSVIVLKRDKILVFSDKNYKYANERALPGKKVIKEINKEKLCPLRHLLLLSRTMDEKQLNAFHLAIKYKFPMVDLVDFNKKTIKVGKKEIIIKWNSIISDQKGSVEEDFVRTLRSALKSLENEHHSLFEKIRLIVPPGDYSEYSLSPLFNLLLYMPVKKLRKIPNQPKIGIASLRFEVVFELEEENIPHLTSALREALSSDFLQVIVNEMGRIRPKKIETQDKEYFRVRISITLEAPNSISLENSTMVAKELAYLVVEEVLYELSTESYTRFKKHKVPEFWLKNAGIVIEVSPSLAVRAKRIIRSYFRSHLDPSRKIRMLRKSKDRINILSNLYFSPAYDYVVDMKEEGIFQNIEAEDPYSRVGIEYLMRKEFDQALKFFRKAKSVLMQDLQNIDSEGESKRDTQREFLKIKNYFLLNDLSPEGVLLSPSYTKETNPGKILEMLSVTEKWIRTTTRLRDIEILERQMRLQHLDRAEYAKTIVMLRRLMRKINVRFYKNFHNFIEDIGSFYVNLLQEIEKESPESIKEWMNLKI
ncbi:MAG: hypothetical protein AYK19_09810 [Theionarchaea archaeon DG-70-1]|nr:MAG: hypothetical protein AYK19_09810 [Theionarchaea archaeon DG-70-1]